MTLIIGQWVARYAAGGRALGKAHFVESVIADEAITRCGRRLRHIEGTTVEVVIGEPASCRVCWAKP